MSEPEKPFACGVPDCGMSFTNEDHLNVHMKKHDMILQLGFGHKSGTFVADQTPTPTRFIRNCEEVGLFQDLQNVNPFDEGFKRAIESKSGMLILDNMTATPADDLHTPHIFPNLETDINITKDLENPKITGQTSKVSNDVIIHEKIELHTKKDGAPNDNLSYTNSVIKMTHNLEIKNSNLKSDKPFNSLEAPLRPTIMTQNSLEKAIESLSQEVTVQNESQMDAFRMLKKYKSKKEYIHSIPTKKRIVVIEKPEVNQTVEPKDVNVADKYEVVIKLPSGEYVHLSSIQDEDDVKLKTKQEEGAKKAIKTKLMSKRVESGNTFQQKTNSIPIMSNANLANQIKNQLTTSGVNNLPTINLPSNCISFSNKGAQNEMLVTNTADNIKLVNLVSPNSCFLNSIPQGSLVPVAIVKSENNQVHQSIKLPQTLNFLQTPQPLLISSCNTTRVNGAKLNEVPKVAIKAMQQMQTSSKKKTPRLTPLEKKIRALRNIEQIEKDKLNEANCNSLYKLGDGNWSESYVREVQTQFENIHKLHKKTDNSQKDHNPVNDSAINQKPNEEVTDASNLDVRIDEAASTHRTSPVKNNSEAIIINNIATIIDMETESEDYASGTNGNKSSEHVSKNTTRESEAPKMSTSQMSTKIAGINSKSGSDEIELEEGRVVVFIHKENENKVDTVTVGSDVNCEEVNNRRLPFSRNDSRKAATARYRERQKRLMETLQRHSARLGAENGRLQSELSAARRQVATLQLLITHHMKDCSAADALKQCYELVAKDITR